MAIQQDYNITPLSFAEFLAWEKSAIPPNAVLSLNANDKKFFAELNATLRASLDTGNARFGHVPPKSENAALQRANKRVQQALHPLLKDRDGAPLTPNDLLNEIRKDEQKAGAQPPELRKAFLLLYKHKLKQANKPRPGSGGGKRPRPEFGHTAPKLKPT
jgi:hypothetical protein